MDQDETAAVRAKPQELKERRREEEMRKRYVSFVLAAGRYCIPVDQVLQILRLENLMAIPKPPPHVEGVINLRGAIIPVLRLGERLGIPGGAQREKHDQRKNRVIVVRVGSRSCGLDVDEVREIVDIDDTAITEEAATPFGVRPDFLLGIARREETVYLMLDLPRVFAAGPDHPVAAPGQS